MYHLPESLHLATKSTCRADRVQHQMQMAQVERRQHVTSSEEHSGSSHRGFAVQRQSQDDARSHGSKVGQS
jgi:hypothetical protein